jgi:hypothetical protein
MAWKRTDDLDGSEATPLTFGFEGKAYVLDAGTATRKKLEAALRPFMVVANEYGSLPEAPVLINPPSVSPAAANTKTSRTPARRQRRDGAGTKKNGFGETPTKASITIGGSAPHSTIRRWAMDNGYQVGPQGRLSNEVIKAFEDVHAK